MNTQLKIGSLVCTKYIYYTVVAEMREGFVARSNSGKYIFLYEYSVTPVPKYIQSAMLNIYFHRGYQTVKRFWNVG